jgi:hypothetical protein
MVSYVHTVLPPSIEQALVKEGALPDELLLEVVRIWGQEIVGECIDK